MHVKQLPKRPQRQVSNQKKGPVKAEGRLTRRISLAIIFAATFATFAATLANGFVYDDNSQVINNLWIRDISYIPQILISSGTSFLNKAANTYRPMLHLVFMAEYHMFGLNAAGFHLINVLLHSINAVLLFFITSELLGQVGAPSTVSGRVVFFPAGRQLSNAGPLFAALFFALHPVNTEVVSWVSAVPELTFMLFLLVSLLSYIKASQADEGRKNFLFAVSAVSFFLALLGKETAMSLPVLVFACDLSTMGKGAARNWKKYAVLTGVAVLYMIVRTFAVGGVIHHKQIDLSAYEAILNAFPLLLEYVWKLILPINLNALYQFSAVTSVTAPSVIGGAAIALGLCMAAILLRKIKILFVSVFMLSVPLLPVLYIPALSSAAFADRYLYLPSAAFAMVLAYILNCGIKGACKTDAPQRPSARFIGKAFIALAVLIAIVYSAGSIKRSLVWKDDYTLWSDTVKKSPLNANVHYNLAWAMQKKGMVKEAEAHYKEVIRLDVGAYDAHYNLGVLYMDMSMPELAEAEFAEALRLNPGYEEAARKLGEARLLRGVK